MPTDRSGLQVLSRSACMELLSSVSVRVGRVALFDDGHPLILPVNYALDDGRIVIRTHPGSKLHAAADGAPIAFEVDEMDPAFREGWSVVMQGHVEVVSDPDELRHLQALPLRPWAPAAKDHFLRIKPTSMTGRQVG